MSTKKAILWFLFVTTPVTLLTGYIVYRTKEILLTSGVSVNGTIYWLVLFFFMWLALTLSSKKIIKEMHERNKMNHLLRKTRE